MEMLDYHRQNRLVHLIEQGAHEPALELLKGDNHISEDELNKSLILACQHGYELIVQMLVRLGADVNYRDINGNTPLLISVQNGLTDIVKFLLTKHADVNASNSVGDSTLILSIHSSGSLHIALCQGHTECAKLLIQHGAIIDFNQVLRLAIEQQEPKYVRFVIENYKNEAMESLKISSNIQYILCMSVRKGNLEIIGHILDLGADINSTESSHMFPLALSKNGEVAKFLIDRGADVNYRYGKHLQETRHYTPLIDVLKSMESTDECIIEVIKVLLENGASANDRRWNGKTALMLAAVKEGSMSVMQLLLDHGAGLNEKDREGNTALTHATLTGCVKNLTFLLQCSKDRKELLNVQNDEGLTALMYAALSVDSTIFKELIDQGADVNIKDKFGNTCLLNLLRNERHVNEILKYLIQAGCDVNCQNNEGLSPLMMAAKNYLKYTMCVLLDSGAEINAVSHKDNTKTVLAHLVYRRGDFYYSCLEYLLDRGANPSYLASSTLHRMITDGDIHFVSKLIRFGLEPVCVSLNDLLLFSEYNHMYARSLHSLAHEVGTTLPCSPLCTALCLGKSAIARFFVRNLFLTKYDVSLLGHNKWINDRLVRENYKECRDILTEITAQPMTLFNLSFKVVSTAIGAAPGHEIRVNKLPVPQIIKDKLLFKID